MTPESANPQGEQEEAGSSVHAALTRYGFEFGALKVTRLSVLSEGYVCIRVASETRTFDIYSSSTGRSIRIFSRGDEWKPAPPPPPNRGEQ